MGVMSELASYREAGGVEEIEAPSRERWATICACGHEDVMHGIRNGGAFGVGQREKMTVDGCRGATPSPHEPKGYSVDGEGLHLPATCPCTKVRPVAEVDRPGRLMRQKVWTRDTVHPFERGLKAVRTRLSKVKSVDDPDAELERRFRWIEAARMCAVCRKKGDGVVPMYVDEGRASELRCPSHYGWIKP